jgi:hypothetical protein
MGLEEGRQGVARGLTRVDTGESRGLGAHTPSVNDTHCTPLTKGYAMTRRDRLVELACLWQEIRADRPPMRHPGRGSEAAPYEDPTRTAANGAQPSESRTAQTALR